MKAISTLTMGNNTYTFEAEEKDDLEALLKVIALANPRTTCNICEDKGLEKKRLNASKTTTEKGTFIYVKVKCLNCGATSTLGQYKGGGYFWKDFEQYQPNGATVATTPNRTHEQLAEEEYSA